METKHWLIVGAIILVVAGFLAGMSYSDGRNNPSQDIEKINTLYSITYLADKNTDTIAVNIIANSNPELPLLKNKVVMNRYEMLEFVDTGSKNRILFAFEGFTSFERPVFKVLTNNQEQSNYVSWVAMKTRGYTPNLIFRARDN